MPDLANAPLWAWPPAIVLLGIAIKYLYPRMMQSLDTQLTQGRTESGLLNQALAEIDKAVARTERAEKRADDADTRADAAFAALVEIRLEMTDMKWQLISANEKITTLTDQLNTIMRSGNATNA